MKSEPLVSVIINNYNYGRFLSNSIDSALNQTYPHVEVVVVDDGSTDESREIIAGYGDRIVAVLKDNGGQASAINAGYAASRGDIICLLDSDDLFLPEKASEVVKLFHTHPDNQWVFTESAPIESDTLASQGTDKVFAEIRAGNSTTSPQIIDYREKFKAAKLPSFTPSTSNLSFSRELLEKIFPLPEVKGYSGMAITDLYIKLLAVGLTTGCRSTQEIGIYRFHNNLYRTPDVSKKRRMFAEIYTTTGYWMNSRFPEFRKMSKKLLSKGFATYLSTDYLRGQSLDADLDKMLKEYLSLSSLLERLEIRLMILYYRLRIKLQGSV